MIGHCQEPTLQIINFCYRGKMLNVYLLKSHSFTRTPSTVVFLAAGTGDEYRRV